MKKTSLLKAVILFGVMTTSAFAAKYNLKMGMTAGTSQNEYKAAVVITPNKIATFNKLVFFIISS